jgi:cell division septation protein DedD
MSSSRSKSKSKSKSKSRSISTSKRVRRKVVAIEPTAVLNQRSTRPDRSLPGAPLSDEETLMEPGGMRNLDEIQEADPAPRASRAGALVLASIGGACIVLAAALLMRSPPKPKPESADPLGDLVARAHPAGATKPAGDDVVGRDVTFPSILSDNRNPTTALEAVRAPAPSASAPVAAAPFPFPAGAPTVPPPAADRLPVVPLPAQHVLESSPAENAPQDMLTSMARHASRESGAETAPPGGPGGFQLQVSSFKTQEEADAFASALRRRGHKAYVEPAQVKGRGLWFRVRIGPFKYKRSAILYRQDFEAKERLVTFIVDPPKTTVEIRPSTDSDDDKDDE